jgi:glycosyltransferase involved in cell wall biosynthesis
MTMRICSIINSLTTGGAEVLVCALAAEFARAGDTPLVVALCDAETLGNSPDTEARMARQLEADGAAYLSLGLSAKRGSIAGALKLRQALEAFDADIVHAHTVRALSMAAAGKPGIPRVLTHHNTKLPFPSRMLRLCDLLTHCYVAIGHEVETILRQHARKPIVQIANAANRSFKPGPPRTLPSGQASILSVGAISAQKNYGLLIDVAAALKEADLLPPLPRFRIAGGGGELEALRTAARARGVGGMVEFLGERSDVPHLMKSSDLYLNVSLYEGMPLTLLEAMASGLPIAATDVPGNRELVQDGVNGMKAPLGDAAAIARTISSILTYEETYAQLSAGSIEKSRDYSIERCAARHRDLYADLLTKRVARHTHPPKEVA